MANDKANNNELVITRVFDAPRQKVWEVWTKPEQVMKWWGPKGYTAPVVKMDVRVGGKSFSCMRSPEGEEYWGVGTYQEIVPLERIAVTDSFADEKGNIVPASHYGMSSDFPLELRITTTFEDLPGGKTKLTLRHKGIPAGEDRDGAQQGWNESFDKLAESLRR